MGYVIFYVFQILATVAALVSVGYMMRRKASFEQKLMLLIVTCIFLVNYGYLMVLSSRTLEAAEAFMHVQYLGIAFMAFLYLLFIAKYVGINLPRPIIAIAFIDALMVVVTSSFDMYFSVDSFEFSDGIAKMSYTFHWPYYVDMAIDAMIILGCVAMVIYAVFRCGNGEERARIRVLLNIVLVLAVAIPVNEMVIPEQLDILPIVLGFDTLFLIVMIEKYNLIDIVTTARDRVFEMMPDTVFLFDEDLKLKDFNAAAQFAFPDIACNMGEALPEKYAFLFYNMDDKLNFKHNGVYYERHISSVFYRDKLLGYSMVIMDVSRTHLMMLQMRELKKQADVASESKSNFLANMSHEIRTPMNAIIGYSDLIVKEVTTREGRDYAKAIRSSSNSLLHIINDILDFSKIEQGRLEIVEEEYLTENLFAEIEDIMSIQADKKGIRLVSSTQPTMPAILYGDKMRLRQIILNVVGNAIKFTEQGSVRIVSEWEPDGPDHARLTVIVSDTGIGITPENMERIFHEFEHADVRRNITTSGTGLGLNISKALLEMMGGSINIESEYGVGTSVIITISQKIVDKTAMASAPEPEFKNKPANDSKLLAPDAKILVVDDNRVNLELMNNFLKQYRIIPDLVESGAASIESAQNTDYDIIFMDQMMPEMDGIEAMKRIRALGGHYGREFPIIALTANAIAGTRSALIGEGFTDYASKPMPIKTLEYLLVKYLPKGTYTIIADVNEAQNPGELARELLPRKRILELPDYIDQTVGMKNAGDDIDQYFNVIGIVYRYADEKIAKIRALLEAEDYKNYTIEVHALKSNAATIGAMKLADFARSLEEAGKRGDNDKIRRNSDRLLQWYEVFKDDLAKCIEREKIAGDWPEDNAAAEQTAMSADTEEYMQTFEEIAAAVREARHADAQDLFNVLDFFELPQDMADRVSEMKAAAEDGRWQTVLDIIAALK